jgi:hypothetical protein
MESQSRGLCLGETKGKRSAEDDPQLKQQRRRRQRDGKELNDFAFL